MSFVRINWHISNWCNYDCTYCTSLIFNKRNNKTVQEHSFDYFPVEQWVKSFESISAEKVFLKITGGEFSLDAKNAPAILEALSFNEKFTIGIDTHGGWNTELLSGINKKQVWFNVSYHPAYISLDKFIEKICALRDAGYNLIMINFVVSPDNIYSFEKAYEQITEKGFFVNVSTMTPAKDFKDHSKRSEEELQILTRYNIPLDMEYKVNTPDVKDKPCHYPANTYYMLYDGTVSIACTGKGQQNFIKDGLPENDSSVVPCPLDKCIGCVDMYRQLGENKGENNIEYTLREYAEEVQAWRKNQ